MICFHRALKRLWPGFAIALLIAGVFVTAHAQSPYVGEVVLVPYNFAPTGWMFCEGQLLPISQYDVLFTLIGTTFGGDGVTNFALPDYRGRVPISAGTHSGITYTLGEQAGVENVTLASNQMPIHTHTVNADSTAGTSKSPKNALIASDAGKIPQYGANVRTTGSAAEIVPAGGSQPHEILQPYNTFHWIISLSGVFPQQNNQFDKNADGESKK